MKSRKILFSILILASLQVGRIAFKSTIFAFVDRTLLSDVIASIIYMTAIICIAIGLIKKKKIDIDIFPKKWTVKYKIFTIFILLFLVVTPIVTKSYQLFNILSLVYNAVITVVYEEIIFRGFIFKEISLVKNDFVAYMTSTFLFGIWHLGYIDTIIWRTSLFATEANIASIMFWKVITGILIGLVLGFLRYKNKNVYSSILAHTFINAFGS